MGAALLLEWAPSARIDRAFEGIVSAMPRHIAKLPTRDHSSHPARVRVWTHELARTPGLAVDRNTGSFLAMIGNPTPHPGAPPDGDDLLDYLLRECLERGAAAFEPASPPFACAFYDGREQAVHVLVDRLGFQHVYLRADDDGNAWICS